MKAVLAKTIGLLLVVALSFWLGKSIGSRNGNARVDSKEHTRADGTVDYIADGTYKVNNHVFHDGTWTTADGKAMIVNCAGDRELDSTWLMELRTQWRPASLDELRNYADEFPKNVIGYVYAGASLQYGELYGKGNPHQTVAYVTGYVPAIELGHHTLLKRLDELSSSDLQLVVKNDLPRPSDWPCFTGKHETIGVLEIPTSKGR